MTEQMQKFLVTATMTTDLILVVEAPEGTDLSDIQKAASTLDGSLFTEPDGFGGGWDIDGAREIEAGEEDHNDADAYDITGDIKATKTTEIQRLNDQFRKTLAGGKIVLTQGIAALDESDAILSRVSGYDDFDDPENDPHREHDSGFFDYEDQEHGKEHRIMWKIDYYDNDMEGLSEDPANPSKTNRVMTVMLAEEY